MRAAFCLLVAAGCRAGFDDVPDAAPRPDAACVPVALPSPALVPSNGITSDLVTCVTANVFAMSLRFDTDTGAIQGLRSAGEGLQAGIGFAVVGSLGVFSADRFAVPAGATWTATGSRPLVLYAASTIDVDGTLDVGSADVNGGPGGGAGSIGDPRSACEGKDGAFKFSLNAGAGAGGGGGATAGGGGASTAADVNGATLGGGGGGVCSQPSTIPLTGGSGGGAGGTENMVVMGGTGGGGGGAVQLVAMTSISISSTGMVASPGAGGASIASGRGGSGGGSGGAVLIESPIVMLAGALTANGGAGARADNPLASDIRAARGHLADAQPAAGTNAGGNGGAGATLPTNGSTLTSGGGGGGAVGMIEIRAVSATGNGVTSPTAVKTQAVVQ